MYIHVHCMRYFTAFSLSVSSLLFSAFGGISHLILLSQCTYIHVYTTIWLHMYIWKLTTAMWTNMYMLHVCTCMHNEHKVYTHVLIHVLVHVLVCVMYLCTCIYTSRSPTALAMYLLYYTCVFSCTCTCIGIIGLPDIHSPTHTPSPTHLSPLPLLSLSLPSLPPSLPPLLRSEDEEDSGDADDEKGDSDVPEYRNVSIQSALKWKHSGDSLLKKFDEDLERVRANTEAKVQNHRDVAVTLHHAKFYPVTRTSYEKSLLSNIEWRWYVWGGLALIGVILLMIIVRTVWCHKHGAHCKLLPMGRWYDALWLLSLFYWVNNHFPPQSEAWWIIYMSQTCTPFFFVTQVLDAVISIMLFLIKM